MAAQSNAQQTFEELVAAVKQAESRGKRYKDDGKTLTTSPKGALGEMQVMPKTVKDPGYGVTPAKDSSADEIARVGVDYLQAMKQKYGDTERALIAYNWGPGSTDKWIAAGAKPESLPAETRTYVQRVKGFLGGPNVSRETTAKTEPTEAEKVMTKALPAGTTAKASVPKIDMANMPASYKAAFALAALADTQDEENDRAFNENKPTETETFFASYKPVNHLASLDLGVEPIAMKDGGDVSAETERKDEPLFDAASRTFVDVMTGRRTPITEKDFTAREQLAMMDAVKKSQARGGKGRVDYQDYPDASTVGPGYVDIRNTLGGFQYKQNPDGSTVISDRYDFHGPRVAEYEKMGTGEKVLKSAKNALTEFVSKGFSPRDAAGELGRAWIGSKGPDVNIRIPVNRADGSPEEGEITKFATQQAPAPANPPATRNAKELDAYIKAMNPGAKVSYFPEGGGTMGYVNSDSPNSLNIQRSLSPQRDEETKLHELEHSLTFRAGDPLGRPKIKAVDNNYQAYYMLGDWRPMSEFTKNMVENKDKLEKFFGRPLNNAYFQPETLASVKKQHGDTSALFDEQMATLSALEQITGKSLTRDPEMKKLFPNTRVMSVFDALTGPRQTRMDARDLPPSTPQPAYIYRDNPVTQFLHKHLIGDNFYPYQKPVRRAEGSPEEGERLTPQQIERIAAQEAADRDAASTAAFIAQKSGIGRKEGNISKALKSGEGQAEMAKGMTMLPQNVFGAPVDLATMAMRPFGYDVEKPFLGSEYLKEKSRNAGMAFKPSDDPTLAGFFGAGDLASNLVNPAGATRAGVQAAEKTGEAAKMLARDFQGYNQQLAVPGASYAVRNKGTPVAMTGLPFLPNVDEAEKVVKDVTIGQMKEPLAVKDKSLNDWFSKTVTRYLRSDFASPQDQLVKAAEEGKLLHLAPKQFSDSADDFNLQHFLQRRQSDLEYVRQAEGFGKSNMATTPYGQRIEDLTDISAYPERVGDLTPERVPPSMRNLVGDQPETRVTDFAPNIVENLKLEQLRDKMLEARQSDGTYGAYGQPAAKVPSEFLLPDDTLAKLNVAAASNRMARFTKWQDETRQKMATTALRADPAFPRAQLQDGKFIGVALPDIKKNPEAKQLVTDVGCDGGWCTRYTPNAEAYASGFNRLHVIVTGEGKQARPVAQFAIADNGPSYDTKRFSITEVKEKGNTVDFENNPALPAIQQYIQYLDKTYGGLDYVDNLKGMRMTALPEYPEQVFDLYAPSYTQKMKLADKFGNVENGLRAVRDKAVDLNNGSRFIAGTDTDRAKMLEEATTLLVGPKENLARQIQMNLFGLPKEKAHGGMIERQPNDNRRYL
jgi:hypothetical protein